ncbi:MAG TPA: glycosyltransferase family 2 protein [Lactovum miscens]|uniref:glycosyltransferase family 2 protein n=1 Tax=Lactovum miscens TaxID=190387 RepID=UPI002EDABEDC
MKKILLVIPAYNEEESIINTLESIENFKKSEKLTFQLDYLVVNDGSKDSTAELVRSKGVKMIDMSVNLGLTGGFMAGMKYAARNKYDAVIQFDADGQHLPEHISDMVAAYESGANVVIGSRFFTRKRPNSLRMFGNILISLAIKITTGKTIKDPTSGMRLFDSNTIHFYINNSNMSPEPETVSFLIKKGFVTQEVQVTMKDRFGGESYFNFKRSIQYMTRVVISILILQPFRK